MSDFPCCGTGNSSDCGRIDPVNEVGPESAANALDPALTPAITEAVMDDTEPRPQAIAPAPSGQQAYDAARQLWQDTTSDSAYETAAGVMAHLDAALGFDVYCPAHRAKHRFGIRDVEELVYALMGELADARTEPADDRQEADRTGSEVADEMCPLAILRFGNDGEGYAEHVENNVDARILAALSGDAS